MDIVFNMSRSRCFHYSCSNPDSQGALIAETSGFPRQVSDREFRVYDVYLDRAWQETRYKLAMETIGNVAVESVSWGEARLKRFARVLFQEVVNPEHVRLVYYYNVATGYSCPYVLAVFGRNRKEVQNVPD